MKDKMAPVSVDVLIDYFNGILTLNEQEKDILGAHFFSRLYRKKQYLLQEGNVCNTFNFVVSGCMRLYKADEGGSNHIVQFATENWWITDLGSFYTMKPSELNIEAIEDTTVLQIKHKDLLKLYIHAPKFNRIFRVLVENNLITMQERLLQTMTADAKVRYHSFLKQYPNLSNRIPNTYIASFLGITPEFLSKIRKQ